MGDDPADADAVVPVDTGNAKDDDGGDVSGDGSVSGDGDGDGSAVSGSRRGSELSSLSGQTDPSFHPQDEDDEGAGGEGDDDDVDDVGKEDNGEGKDGGEEKGGDADDEGDGGSKAKPSVGGGRRPMGLGRGLMVDRSKGRNPSGAVIMMDDPLEKKKAQRKRELLERRAKAKRDRADRIRRENVAQKRLIERQARRIRTAANLWGLAAGSSWDTSDSDEDGNRIEKPPKNSSSRGWRAGLFSCLSFEDGAGVGHLLGACVCPCCISADTARAMHMKTPCLHGFLGGVPPLCFVHALFMRIRIKAKYGIHYGVPLPQDCLAAVLCFPCAVVQHRADVVGGYRLRRDQVITMQGIPVKSDIIETDKRWALKRYIPGAQDVAVVSPEPPSQEDMGR